MRCEEKNLGRVSLRGDDVSGHKEELIFEAWLDGVQARLLMASTREFSAANVVLLFCFKCIFGSVFPSLQ